MRFTLSLLLACGLAACSTPSRQAIGTGTWQVLDINGSPPVGGKPITMTLADGRASGSAGCNSYSAPYQLSAREGIRFGQAAVTRVLCEPAAIMEQERRFLEILSIVRGFSRYVNDDVSLIGADGRAIRMRRTS